MASNDGSRRAFLGSVSAAGAALAATGAVASTAEAGSSVQGRKATEARPGAPFSRAVSFNGVVFVAGVVGRAPGQDDIESSGFKTQCDQALKNLKASVEAAGSTMANVLKCNCFLTDIEDFPTFNKIFRGYFPSSPPARSTVIVKELVVPGAKLEIDCVTCVV